MFLKGAFPHYIRQAGSVDLDSNVFLVPLNMPVGLYEQFNSELQQGMRPAEGAGLLWYDTDGDSHPQGWGVTTEHNSFPAPERVLWSHLKFRLMFDSCNWHGKVRISFFKLRYPARFTDPGSVNILDKWTELFFPMASDFYKIIWTKTYNINSLPETVGIFPEKAGSGDAVNYLANPTSYKGNQFFVNFRFPINRMINSRRGQANNATFHDWTAGYDWDDCVWMLVETFHTTGVVDAMATADVSAGLIKRDRRKHIQMDFQQEIKFFDLNG